MMYRKEVNAQSPLRILEASMHGGLGKGNLGVIMARAGVGKTACLIQIALDDLMHDKDVLHIALGQTLDHVSAWYGGIFEDLARATDLEDRDGVRASIGRHRIIQCYSKRALTAAALDELLDRLSEHAGFRPAAVLIDDFDWSGAAEDNVATLSGWKAAAGRVGAELWLTAQVHRDEVGAHPETMPEPGPGSADLIDVAIFLEPRAAHVELRLLKDHDNPSPASAGLRLHPETMRLTGAEIEAPSDPRLPSQASTLLTGGAEGAEAEFGACAEQWGLREVVLAFDGQHPARTRGVRVLSGEELEFGNVSDTYLQARLGRSLPQKADVRNALRALWHVVNPAGEVFSVGTIQDDDTVSGGTGWAVELARHWDKPVYVFDQDKGAWFEWSANAWRACTEEPVIRRTRFAGTGTRNLTDAGRKAIGALFARSFGR